MAELDPTVRAMRARLARSAIGLLFLAADNAHAHAVSPNIGDFYAGLLHPVTALEHVLPILALGLLAGQRGLNKAQALLIVFPVAFAAGACVELLFPNVPGVFLINIASAVVCGGLVALAWLPPLPLLYGLAIVFGLSHGYANGAAMTPQMKPLLFIGGLGFSAFLAFAYGFGVTDLVLRQKPSWLSIAVRVAGSWIAAIGILVISISHKTILMS